MATAGKYIEKAEQNLEYYEQTQTTEALELAKVEALIAIAKCLDNLNKNGVVVERP